MENIPVCTEAKKMKREERMAVDSPDGDSLAFSLHIECDVCACSVCACVCVVYDPSPNLPAEAELSFISH